VNGKEDGAWVKYYENGKVKDEDIYNDGVCAEKCEGNE
jgi:antitoxin component YwqK of YwqJK toxin-antitoxin module